MTCADIGLMDRGYSLAELAFTLALICVVTILALPGWARLLDRFAVEQAASELTTALAVARNAAVLRGTNARLSIASDTLGMDVWMAGEWTPAWRIPGPEAHSVGLEVTNRVVTFGANGIGVGASNTQVVLRRGRQAVKLTTSRVGRVKRW